MFESLRFAMELGVDDHFDDLEPSIEVNVIRAQASSAFRESRLTTIDPRRLGIENMELLTGQPLYELERGAPDYENELSLVSRIEHENRRVVASAIVDRVRNDLYRYLLSIESALLLSAAGEDVFDRHRQRVESVLRAIAPEVLDMLTAAIARSAEVNNPESHSHALTSCRRVLEAVADLVFPAREEPHVGMDGVERSVRANQYRNRIIAFVEQAGSTTLNRAVSASIADLASRLGEVDALTQKGVHSHPTQDDVDFGVVQTYLLAGEVLAIHSRPDTPVTSDSQR